MKVFVKGRSGKGHSRSLRDCLPCKGRAPIPPSFLKVCLGLQVMWKLQQEPATLHAIPVFRGCQHPPSHTCCSQISQPDFFSSNLLS